MVSLLRPQEGSVGSANVSNREFVAGYWPNHGTPGKQLKDMYDRIRAAELKAAADAKATVTEAAGTHGLTSNGHGPSGSN